MPEPSPPPLPIDPALRAREFPVTERTVYLNAAAVSILPQRALRAQNEYNERRAWIDTMRDADFSAPLERSRAAAARLVNAAPEEIALVGNTSHGINLAALALPVRPGTRVVVSDREFPANVYPWMRREGVELEVVPADARGAPDVDRLLERLGRGDVSVFALSAVQFASGYRADLEALGRACAEHGVFFVVDAIQALGQVPVDVRAARIDVLACGGHKWLLSPFGAGFVYVRRGLLERMEPRVVGWSSMRAAQDLTALLDYRFDLVDDARRFEVATLPLQDYAAFAESLGLLLEVGVARIEAHLAGVLAPVRRWLAEREDVVSTEAEDPARRSAILSFRPPDPDAAWRALRAAGVVCALREGAIRLAPHLYNTPEELERVVEVLERGARG